MTYELAIGDRAYSTWSLRGWLLFAAFDIPVTVHRAQMWTPEFTALLDRFAPTETVPAVRTPHGALVTDSIAIAETLAEAHPEAGHWPTDPKARGMARSLAAEMHSGFGALRTACPMNLRVAWAEFTPDAATEADLARLERLWNTARDLSGSDGWLFGAYSAVDAFFAPVAARIAGYDLPVSDAAQAYVAHQLTSEPVVTWRRLAQEDGPDQPKYHPERPTRPWPYPV